MATSVMPTSQAAPLVDGVFASVFSPLVVKPPKRRRRFAPKTLATIPEIQTTLHQHLRVLLGIGDESFFYGQEQVVSDTGSPFHSHLESCPPLNQLRQPTAADHATQITREAESPIWGMLARWRAAVGSETVIKLLASVLNDLMTEFVTWSYAGIYRQGLHLHLEFWVEHLFSRIARKVLCCLDEKLESQTLPETEVRKWKDMATARLGALRVDELFEIIVDWDATAPAIEDLRHFTTNPTTRGYLTHNFVSVLQARLLHPGASTIEILQFYISIIRSFRILDPRGVLLDRVIRRVRRYLRERDDTVKVIVSGLLADISPDEDGQPPPSDPDVLTELAHELTSPTSRDNTTDDSEFDWNNMDWVPDPIDAAPDYTKSNKTTDVIGSLVTLFETKDVFVKELQSAMAERLLKNKADFNQEIGVLEHLKLRFGDAGLQGCEVMLRDVLDSKKVDKVIRRDLEVQQAKKGRTLKHNDDSVQIHAKILSRLFWPAMPEQSFNVPAVVTEQQRNYEQGFGALKQSRKLTWVNTIGQVEVELELEDRTYHDEVLPWQATVIYAFQDDTAGTAGQPVQKTVTELASELAMSPTLIRSACIFWVSKRILAETSPNTFSVLERLPSGTNDDNDTLMSEGGASANQQSNSRLAAAEAAAFAAATREAEEAERKQKMAMYHRFIVSMLTNQGAMPLARISMMLSIVVPGGFPFSNEELKEFLASMVKEEALEVGTSGVYKVASGG
ncbi:uncharacterized protein Z520_10842 [Fonsecaea multimorphosa CBS 102226]|uniref:Anaphase-promoting complex subunit 2 n=1 Tax=Fonsecaea multimorphosa CBS 102226 TaxID=1442371 RepID=A0A0D2KAI5_9EURO|nr:uncharacterized protein Z520_10842 [Fonsecaea multimorphosa CBS 102226]KIX93423.1 hypothetical protein Z520_10842 [Fonsecaea multimorphosa CBS 102226]OAL18721.1 hypothetical protein AYO22_10414 [Fonsecaea multimorphosa]